MESISDELRDLIKKANERDSAQAFFEWGLEILREMIKCQSTRRKEMGAKDTVKLEAESTPMGKFQKERTDAISEMFDNPDECGIYPTSKFFARLDNCVRALLIEAPLDIKECD